MKKESKQILENHVTKVTVVEDKGDDHYQEWTRLRREILWDSAVENKNDIEYYKTYLDIIKDATYYTQDHVTLLCQKFNLEPDIIVVMTKKGVGKSFDMRQKINAICDRGKQVVLLRVLDTDVDSGLRMQLDNPRSSIYMKGSNKFLLYHKTLKDESNPKQDLFCGIASGVKRCAKWKGDDWEKVEAIFFDEFTNDRDAEFTEKDMKQFFTHVANSIEREKTIPIVMYGNNDQKMAEEQPILATLGIDPETNLKYIVRQFEDAEKPSRILYINTRGLYSKGAQHSRFIGCIADVFTASATIGNLSPVQSHKITSVDLSVMGSPWVAIVFSKNQEYWVILTTKDKVYNKERKKMETWYSAKIEVYSPNYTFGYKRITDEPAVYNLFSNTVKYVERSDCWDYWSAIIDAQTTARCQIVKNETAQHIAEVLKLKESEYAEEAKPKVARKSS